MKKVLEVALSALATVFFSLSASATPFVQTIDDFESGLLAPVWTIIGVSPGDVSPGIYQEIQVYQSGGLEVFYHSPGGERMAVLSGGNSTITLRTSFVSYPGAMLNLSWLGAFIDGELPSCCNGVTEVHNDTVGFRINGVEFIFADAITTTLGVGYDNTRWQELVRNLPVGDVTLDLWARNADDSFNGPRLAIDNVRLVYADIPPELQGGGGNAGGGSGNGGGTGGGGTTSPIPEPSTIALLGLGLFSLTVMRFRRRELSTEVKWKPTARPVIRRQ